MIGHRAIKGEDRAIMRSKRANKGEDRAIKWCKRAIKEKDRAISLKAREKYHGLFNIAYVKERGSAITRHSLNIYFKYTLVSYGFRVNSDFWSSTL